MADRPPSQPPQSVYFLGQVVPMHQAHVSISDQGVLYGLGFFETFRTSGGRLHHWSYHEARLSSACARAGITLPASFLASSAERMSAIVSQLLVENGCDDAAFRYTVTAGADGVPTEFLTARALPPAAPSGGIRLRVLKLRRDSGEWIPRPKSLNYLNASLGARELHGRQVHPSDEGLFLARAGHVVVETVRQNIVWINEGTLRFPDDSCGAVAGTCLAWLRESGSDFKWESARAGLDTLLQAEAIFCVNALRGITPIAEVWDETDATRLGTFGSAQHPTIVEFQARWAAALNETAGR